MTRETKIGLLVGLGFIILFGIILSEAGSRRRAIVAPQYGPLADAQRDYVQPGPSVMLGPLDPDGDLAEPEPVLAAAEPVAAEKPARQEPVVTDGSDRTSPPAEPAVDNTPSPEFVAYVVRKNDNLTKIAKRVMQTDSRKAVEAQARHLRRRGGPYATVCQNSQTKAVRAMLESEGCSGLVPATDG